ncbi:MAG: hypothetical protein RR922_02765 [Clostridia bacterium]
MKEKSEETGAKKAPAKKKISAEKTVKKVVKTSPKKAAKTATKPSPKNSTLKEPVSSKILKEKVNTKDVNVPKKDMQTSSLEKLKAKVFSPYKKQYDETFEKRIILLISYCIFMCVLIGLMAALYICLIYSTMPLRKNASLTKDDLNSLNMGNSTYEEAIANLEGEIKAVETKINAEQTKQAPYNEKEAKLATLIQTKTKYLADLEGINKQVADASNKIDSLTRKLAELDALITKLKQR